jgi:hypothetical protein
MPIIVLIDGEIRTELRRRAPAQNTSPGEHPADPRPEVREIRVGRGPSKAANDTLARSGSNPRIG